MIDIGESGFPSTFHFDRRDLAADLSAREINPNGDKVWPKLREVVFFFAECFEQIADVSEEWVHRDNYCDLWVLRRPIKDGYLDGNNGVYIEK